MKKIEKKAKFYDLLTKVLKFGGIALAAAGLVTLVVSGIAGLAGAVGASVAVITGGAVGLLGCGAYLIHPTAKVYADGYKAELEKLNIHPEVESVQIGDLIKEQEEKEIVYETPHEAFYAEASDEKDATK